MLRQVVRCVPKQFKGTRNYALFAVTTASDLFGDEKATKENVDRNVAILNYRLDKIEIHLAQSIMTRDKTYARHVLQQNKKSHLMAMYIKYDFFSDHRALPSSVFKRIKEYNDTNGSDELHEFAITNKEIFDLLLNCKKVELQYIASLKGFTNFFQTSKDNAIRKRITDYTNDLDSIRELPSMFGYEHKLLYITDIEIHNT